MPMGERNEVKLRASENYLDLQTVCDGQRNDSSSYAGWSGQRGQQQWTRGGSTPGPE